MKYFFLRKSFILSCMLLFIACGEESSKSIDFQLTSQLKQTGQVKSYDSVGLEVLDSSLKDDGFYQQGSLSSYARDNGKEIVKDYLTGLMWQDNTAVSSITKPWITHNSYSLKEYANTTGDTAITYCKELNLGGFEDWRLPTREELVGLVDYGKVSPAINTIFQNGTSGTYWSSTANVRWYMYAWIVNFELGYQDDFNKKNNYYIRCVRKA